MKSLIIIPTYDERENLGTLIPEIFKYVPETDILFVDDNSPDGTAQYIKEQQANNKQIHLIERSGKMGLGTAYIAGFKWALQRSYDTILEMDADGSHQPKYLPKLLDTAKTCDLVLGSRYIPGGGTRNWSLFRRFLSRGTSLYTKALLFLPYSDLTGGFKCFRRHVLESMQLDQVKSEGYCFQIELTYLAHKKGFKIKEVPIIFSTQGPLGYEIRTNTKFLKDVLIEFRRLLKPGGLIRISPVLVAAIKELVDEIDGLEISRVYNRKTSRQAVEIKKTEKVTRKNLLGKYVEEGENLVLRIPDFPTSTVFRDGMHAATLAVLAQLRSVQILTIRALLDFLAAKRQQIANQMGDSVAYGKDRREIRIIATTPIHGKYYSFYHEAWRLLATEGIMGKLYSPRAVVPGTGRNVPLTSIMESENNGAMWVHMSHGHIDLVINYLETLFVLLQSPTITDQNTIRIVSSIHWWLAHAMPYVRGSAAISDALTKALFYWRGIYPGRWREGISPDIYAFHHSLEEFVRDYPSLFE